MGNGVRGAYGIGTLVAAIFGSCSYFSLCLKAISIFVYVSLFLSLVIMDLALPKLTVAN